MRPATPVHSTGRRALKLPFLKLVSTERRTRSSTRSGGGGGGGAPRRRCAVVCPRTPGAPLSGIVPPRAPGAGRTTPVRRIGVMPPLRATCRPRGGRITGAARDFARSREVSDGAPAISQANRATEPWRFYKVPFQGLAFFHLCHKAAGAHQPVASHEVRVPDRDLVAVRAAVGSLQSVCKL